MKYTRRLPLAPTEIFEDISVEFDFESGANTRPVSLPSFDLD